MGIVFGTLCSGSKGNCAVFHDGERTVLIDAGKSRKYIVCSLESAGISPDSVSDVFITHDHSDHTGALQILTKHHGVRVHCAYGTADCICGLVAEKCLQPHPTLYSCDCGGFSVSSFATSHDTRVSVGYRIDCGCRSFGYATDLGVFTDSVSEALRGCECVILESNHDLSMLLNGPYEYSLKKRIASDFGHLSNDCAAEAAVKLVKSGTKKIILAHLSEENNDPALALNTVRRGLLDAGITAVPVDREPGENEVALCVALQCRPVLLDL